MARKPRTDGSTEAVTQSPESHTTAADVAAAARGLIEAVARLGELATVDDLMAKLRGHRLFADLAALGTSLQKAGLPRSATNMRLTAQSLIELGRFQEATAILESIVALGASGHGTAVAISEEVLEAHGLLGRIHKQRYVNECFRGRRVASLLRLAVQSYLTAFDGDSQRADWHGINAAALLARAVRDKVSGLPVERAKIIAGDVRDRLIGRFPDHASYWDLAIIAEASLVLDELEKAELWFNRAFWHAGAEPFMLASTLRQLREVWLLDLRTPPGSRILPPLDAQLYLRGGTQLVAPPVAAGRPMLLEKTFAKSPFMPFQAWAAALECAKSVCRVEDKLNQGIGTGFVVNGKLLHKDLPNQAVLLTNAHVLSPKGDGESLTANQAHVSFYANPDKANRPHTSKIAKLCWSSPPDALDCTIALLDEPPRVKASLSFAANLPAANAGQKVYVIGHPGGGGLMFSLNDNELLDYGDPADARVHYRTPTEPGSSGSPVFNSQWELIALHHAGDVAMERIHGSGTYEANEGIAFKQIAPAIRLRR